jgi:membrane associated rhomboid family serine protease
VVHGNQAWRLESCTWLHAGLIHLLANMISLIFIGVRLEQQFGFCNSPNMCLMALSGTAGFLPPLKRAWARGF